MTDVPSSSIHSRARHSRRVSPFSSFPPGNSQRFAQLPPAARRQIKILPSFLIMAAATCFVIIRTPSKQPVTKTACFPFCPRTPLSSSATRRRAPPYSATALAAGKPRYTAYRKCTYLQPYWTGRPPVSPLPDIPARTARSGYRPLRILDGKARRYIPGKESRRGRQGPVRD